MSRFDMRKAQKAEKKLFTSSQYRDFQERLAGGGTVKADDLPSTLKFALGLKKRDKFKLTTAGGRRLALELNESLENARPASQDTQGLNVRNIAAMTYGLPEGFRKVIGRGGKSKTQQPTVSQPQIKDASIPNQEATTREAVLPEGITVAGGGKAFTSPSGQAGVVGGEEDAPIPGSGGLVGGFGEILNQLLGKKDAGSVSQNEDGQQKLYDKNDNELRMSADQKTLVPVNPEIAATPVSEGQEGVEREVGLGLRNQIANFLRPIPRKLIGAGASGVSGELAKTVQDAKEGLDVGDNPLERFTSDLKKSIVRNVYKGKPDEQQALEYLKEQFPDTRTPGEGVLGRQPAKGRKKFAGIGEFRTPFGRFHIDETGAFRRL